MSNKTHVHFRVDTPIYDEIMKVAARYGMNTTDAFCFILQCGLDSEKSYRPILKTAVKVCDLLDDLQQSDKGECIA